MLTGVLFTWERILCCTSFWNIFRGILYYFPSSSSSFLEEGVGGFVSPSSLGGGVLCVAGPP